MTGRATRLEAVRDAMQPGACLTIDELDCAVDLGRQQIVDATMKLISRGLMERVERGCYQLTLAGVQSRQSREEIKSGPKEPLTGKTKKKRQNLRVRLWRAMRVKQKFTIAELVAVASIGDPEKDHANAQKYLRALEVHGYLRQLPRQKGVAITSNGFKRYQLIKTTGPGAPEIKRKGLYDPNTGELHENGT